MMGLRPWADICIGVGFLFFFIYFVVILWQRSRHKNQPLRTPSDLMHKALVETGLHSYVQQSEHGYAFYVDGASNGKDASHAADVKNASHTAIETPMRAYNLDKADKNYKGRQYSKAKLAALGEEVRRKIAGIGPQEEENGGRSSAKEEGSVEGGRKLDRADKDSGNKSARSADSSLSALSSKTGVSVPESSEMSWGRCYTQKELEEATNSFSDANVLGHGSSGTVYRGVLQPNGTHIVLKNLSNNRGQAEKDFKLEVEAIGRVRHKNLVRLSGYCMEGFQRILVYEYIDNGNLEQWLHGSSEKSSSLSWEVRMKIIIGTARGLAYLHEGLEPKVVHRDVKPSNILLDSQWNAKVSDFGFAKLLGAGKSHVTTRVMGTFGYVAPEYVSTGMLTEKSDVYSYGVLVMELITGRVPVDRNRPAGEVHLVDWLKSMVGSRRSEEVADPNMVVKPSARSLKRALLVALRCVDPDASKRPKMGHIVHMLESADDNPFCQEPKIVEVYHQRRVNNHLPTTFQKHKRFTIPAFMLASKSNPMDNKPAQIDPSCRGPFHEDGGFVGIIDTKTTWKYER